MDSAQKVTNESGLSIEQLADSLLITSSQHSTEIPFNRIIGLEELSSEALDLLYIDTSGKPQHIKASFPPELPSFLRNLNAQLYNSPKNIAIIVNPISGSKKAKEILNKVLLEFLSFTPHSYTVFESTQPNYVPTLVQTVSFAEYTDLICVSGDGTFHLLLSAFHNTQPEALHSLTFSILPGGTRNALAVELYGNNVYMACLHSVKETHVNMDVLEAKTDSRKLLAINNVTWGAVSQICETAENLRSIGKIRFILSGAYCFLRNWRPYRANVQYRNDGESNNTEIDFQYINLTNHRNPKINSNEIASPNSCINDKKMDILMHPFSGRLSTIMYLRKLANQGLHITDSRSTYTKCDYCKIQPVDMDVFNIDGEIYYSSHVTVKVLPGFLRVTTINAK